LTLLFKDKHPHTVRTLIGNYALSRCENRGFTVNHFFAIE